VQVFQKGPLFPKKLFKNNVGQILGPHSAGPACTARLARPIVTPLAKYTAQLAVVKFAEWAKQAVFSVIKVVT